MQASKSVEKFSKKKVYDPVGEEVRKRKKVDNRTGDRKFRNQFLDNRIALNAQSFLYD